MAQAKESESGRAGHKSKSGATLAVDRGRRVLARRVCRSHEGNGVNMTEKGRCVRTVYVRSALALVVTAEIRESIYIWFPRGNKAD